MVTIPEAISPDSPPAQRPSRVVAAVTVLGWLLLAALIGSAYVGHSPGPYGVCYAASGRSVPCDVAHR
jgi:hypothetical protein